MRYHVYRIKQPLKRGIKWVSMKIYFVDWFSWILYNIYTSIVSDVLKDDCISRQLNAKWDLKNFWSIINT